MGNVHVVPGRGRWMFLAASPALVVLPGDAAESVVEAVRAVLRSGDGRLESIVSAIPLRGGSAVASFAVLRLESTGVAAEGGDPLAGTTVVVVRGRAAVDLVSAGGARRFEALGVQPWALAEFEGVTAVSLGELPLHPLIGITPSRRAERLEAGLARGDSAFWSDVAAPAPESRLVPEPAPQPGADPDPAPAPEPGPDPAPAPDPGREPVPAPLFDLTVNDHAPVHLARTVVIGRNPRARPGDRPETFHLIPVPSPQKEVSSNHVEIALSGRTVVITDLRSTNGTTVVVDGREPVRLRPGDSVVARASAIVGIGDGNVVRISPRDRKISGITP